MRRPSRIAPPCAPTWNPMCSAASSATESIAGRASLWGKTATASLHASGPHIGGASSSAPRSASSRRAKVRGASMHRTVWAA
eukprot:3205911-Lingulodinium_polyedra.AAC.1